MSPERIPEIYNSLESYRSTKAELVAIAEELETKYKAVNAQFIRERELYEKRDRLRKINLPVRGKMKLIIVGIDIGMQQLKVLLLR